MKHLFALLSMFCFISCEIKSNQNNPSPPNVSSIPTPPIQNTILEPEPNHKFVFVFVKTEEPHLDYSPPSYYRDSDFNVKTIDETTYIEWVEYISCSEIIEYNDFTEDDDYMLMDKAKISALSKTTNFMFELNQVQDLDRRRELSENRIRIKLATYLEFDSYKEASIKRDEILNANNHVE